MNSGFKKATLLVFMDSQNMPKMLLIRFCVAFILEYSFIKSALVAACCQRDVGIDFQQNYTQNDTTVSVRNTS